MKATEDLCGCRNRKIFLHSNVTTERREQKITAKMVRFGVMKDEEDRKIRAIEKQSLKLQRKAGATHDGSS